MTTDDIEGLRQRLLFMRRDLVARLVKQIGAGELGLLGSVGLAIAALDAMAAEEEDTAEAHG
jgi:hypothetical protein